MVVWGGEGRGGRSAREARALKITRRISVAPLPAARRMRSADSATLPLSANYSQSTDVLVVGTWVIMT
ncbi:hypothetical protein RR46_06932 [Papilio xuthus]|uniref:Uncharacterized protein n=1 Tax=Papilio xuthus TaxID=66420 RepID=A0A194PTA3_PAPXU|nr:hypothetical protein RR46_06932 [Papilio xuthus]